MAAQQSMAKAMTGATKVMQSANKTMNLQKMQQQMMEFEKANTMMDMKEEMSTLCTCH